MFVQEVSYSFESLSLWLFIQHSRGNSRSLIEFKEVWPQLVSEWVEVFYERDILWTFQKLRLHLVIVLDRVHVKLGFNSLLAFFKDYAEHLIFIRLAHWRLFTAF